MSRYSNILTPFSNGPEFVAASSKVAFENTLEDSNVMMIVIIVYTSFLALATVVLVIKKRKNHQ